MSGYRPRRQSRRWLDGDCPAGVLAIYDNGGGARRGGTFDRFTVFYVPTEPLEDRSGWVSYVGASEHPTAPQGFGQHGELRAFEVAAYRYRVAHQACRWSDLPPDVQRMVRRDLELMESRAE